MADDEFVLDLDQDTTTTAATAAATSDSDSDNDTADASHLIAAASSAAQATSSAKDDDDDEFEYDDLPPVEEPADAPREDDDEFEQVWEEATAPERKRLAPSKKQKQLHSQPSAGKADDSVPASVDDDEDVQDGLQADVLEKLNLPPTTALNKYRQDDAEQDEEESEEEEEEEEAAPMEEWERVSALRKAAADAAEEQEAVIGPKSGIAADISVVQALRFLSKHRKNELQPDIQRFDTRNLGFFARLRFKCFGGPSLGTKELEEERDAMLRMALMQLDYECEEMERIVQTIYRAATKDKLACPRFGGHWDLLGFQGNDPATDLRASGMLGLVQLLHFVTRYPALSQRVLQLSRDEEQNFPFAVVSLNITGMVVRALRETRLHSEIKSVGSAYDVANELHAALMYEMFMIWRNEYKTVVDFSEVRDRLRESAATPLKALEAFRITQKANIDEDQDQFTEIP